MEEFDILVMPGAAVKFIEDALGKDEGLVEILRRFAGLSVVDGREKWLLSVCTGALFLGAAGLLHQKTVTTHWAALETLNEICTKAGSNADVVRKRFVDAGKQAGGVRMITAGGVSCGMDAALWVAGSVYGQNVAVDIAKGMDYRWEYGADQVEVTEGWVV